MRCNIEGERFEAWLAARRATARVAWNWDPVERTAGIVRNP